MRQILGDAIDFVRRFPRRHHRTLFVLAGLVAILGWFTISERGGVDWTLVGFVFLLGVGYVVLRDVDGLSEPMRERTTFALVAAGMLGVLGILSGWNPTYLVFVSIQGLIFALFALGLNIEYGFTGIINFGHVAFLGVGAYTTALLADRWIPQLGAAQLSPGLSLLAMAATGLLLGLLAAAIVAVLFEGFQSRYLPSTGRRTQVAVAGLAALVPIVTIVTIVPFPLTTFWAQAFIVGTTIAIGAGLAAGLGLLLGLPTLRLRADYLAIVTIGAAEILRLSWLNERWLTNGARGVRSTFPFPQAAEQWTWLSNLTGILGARVPQKVLLLLMVLVALGVTYILAEILLRSPYGRVLKAIREDEEVAESLGKNVFAYKLQSLAIGSVVASVAGALLAWNNIFFTPSRFLPIYTFYAWIIIVMGGLGNNRGTILGALVLITFLRGSNFLHYAENLGLPAASGSAFRQAVIGMLLIAFMMFKPEGLLGRKEEMVLGD